MKRTMSLVLTMAMIFVMAIPVQARWEVQTPTSGQYYRIRYANNHRYLDIPSEGYSNNGTQLQLWDYAEGNQNQIFKLEDTGNGWHIVAQNGKIVEVRNSSHDNGAQVAQWGAHNLNCGLWNIVSNKNGSVSFQNRESGKYLNVYGGGDAQNGNKIVQWYNDGTIAMRFYLEILSYEDVISASFDRQSLDISEVQWTQYNKSLKPYVTNYTGWTYEDNNTFYVPKSGQKIFATMEFLDPLTVTKLLKHETYKPSIQSAIKDAVSGEVESNIVSTLAEQLGFGSKVQGISVNLAYAMLKILADEGENYNWNRFVDAAYSNGNIIQGVIVYNYYEISSWSSNGTRQVYYQKGTTVEYKPWTGSNFADVHYTPVAVNHGEWSLRFK